MSFVNDPVLVQSVLGEAGIGLWELDISSNTISWNLCCRETVGHPARSSVSLEEFYGLAASDDRRQLFRAMQSALAGGNEGAVDQVCRMVAADGGIRWVHFTGRIFFDHKTGKKGMGGIVRQVAAPQTKDIEGLVNAGKKAEESESRLRILISSAPVAIATFIGEELIVEMPNEAFIRVVGRGADIAGRPFGEVLPELIGKGKPFREILDNVYKTGVPFHVDEAPVDLPYEHGIETHFFNITFSPLRDSAGKIYGILDVSVDVTELVRARTGLEQAQARLQNAIDLAELGTWSIDALTGRTEYSKRLADWLGIEGQDLNKRSEHLIHSDDRDRVSAVIRAALQKGGIGFFNEVYTINHAITGIPKIIHVVGQTFYDADENPVRLSGMAQDITMQRDLQTALEQEVQVRTEELAAALEEIQTSNDDLIKSNEQLVRSNEELAQYAYVASHDLQEPLRKIHLYSDVLRLEDGLSAKSRTALEKISAASSRMRLLISDLLEFSRLIQSDSPWGEVDLNDVVANVLTDFELVIKEKNAKITVGRLPVLEAVRLQMHQLFYNLISNSLKFSVEGVSPLIDISCRALSSEEAVNFVKPLVAGIRYYEIRVKDNGIGFEQQFANRIFEVFKRLVGQQVYPGSGIGLALCKRIAVNHLGDIYVSSEPDGGAEFSVILPERQSGLMGVV